MRSSASLMFSEDFEQPVIDMHKYHAHSQRNGTHTKRKSCYVGLRRLSMSPSILFTIFVLVFVLTGRGVAADENPPQVWNETQMETEIEILETLVTSSPTGAPSISMQPTWAPSFQPSESKNPSSSPSSGPTMYPTFSPAPTTTKDATEMPSSAPSGGASAVPTLECHDDAGYRSPINNLTCEDHANTDCTQWTFVGLNLTDLQELVESCPETCNVDCGSFFIVDTNISFVISNVPALIDDFMTKTPLETTTRDYLTGYVLKTSPVTKFALTKVELLYQEPLNNTRTRFLWSGLRQHRRHLQEMQQEGEYIDLNVILNVQGYKIYPIKLVLTGLMLEGIDSPEYTAELRRSNPFFANATASSAAQAKPPNVTASSDSEDNSVSPVTVSVITIIAVCAVIFGGTLLYKKCVHARRRSKRKSPVHEETPGPLRPNVFSFDISPTNSTGVGRLLAVFSGESKDSTSPSSSQEAAPSQQKSVAEEHPLTGQIPSMLVIDNIEQTDPSTITRTIPETGDKEKKVVVPTKRMGASASFIDALNRNQTGRNDSSPTSGELVHSVSSLESVPKGDGDKQTPANRALAAALSGDASLPDDTSVSSAPMKGSDMNVDMPLRQTNSSGHLDEHVDVAEVLDQFMKSQWELEEDVFPPHHMNTSMSYDRLPPKPPYMNGNHHRSSSWDKNSPRLNDRKVKKGSSRNLPRMSSLSSRGTRTSNPSPTHKRGASKAGSGGSYLSNELLGSDDECLCVFEASHRGYLGLAIEPCRNGTRIQAVKEYSPLFGLAEPGDRIVSVDGIDTRYKTTAGVADLLRRKKGKKIIITLARNNREAGGIPILPIMTRSRSKSIGNLAVYVPARAQVESNNGLLSSVTDLDTSYEAQTPPKEALEEPFHFLGAAPVYDEDDDFESLSDPDV